MKISSQMFNFNTSASLNGTNRVNSAIEQGYFSNPNFTSKKINQTATTFDYSTSGNIFSPNKFEIIGYDKGSFRYETNNASINFNPNGEKTQRLVLPDCTRIIKEYPDNSKIIEDIDNNNRTIYRELTGSNGQVKSTKFDYDKKRVIIKRFNPNEKPSPTEVYDMVTRKRVFDGPLVEDTIVKKDGRYIKYTTKNIITNAIYSEKLSSLNNAITYMTQYSKVTGKKTHESCYNSINGTGKEKYYDKNENLIKLINYKKHQKHKDITTFDEQGKANLHVLLEFNNDKKLFAKTVYDVENDNSIKAKVEYFDDGKKSVHSYKDNKKIHTNFYLGNVLRGEYFYGKDEQKTKSIKYNKDGSFVEKIYGPQSGLMKYKTCYDSNLDPQRVETMYPGTKILQSVFTILNKYGDCEIISFDCEGKNPISRKVLDGSDNVVEEDLFWEETDKIKQRKIYNNDHSYKIRFYSLEGKNIGNIEFDKDGNRKVIDDSDFFNDFDENGDYEDIGDIKSGSFETSRADDDEQNEEIYNDINEEQEHDDVADLFSKVSSAVAKNGFIKKDIDMKDWQKVSDFFGFDSLDEFFAMDKANYLRLVKQFHSDNISSKYPKQLMNDAFNIIQYVKNNAQYC